MRVASGSVRASVCVWNVLSECVCVMLRSSSWSVRTGYEDFEESGIDRTKSSCGGGYNRLQCPSAMSVCGLDGWPMAARVFGAGGESEINHSASRRLCRHVMRSDLFRPRTIISLPYL